MNVNKAIRNAKFLESIEYIDPSIIAQVAENIKAPERTAASGKRKVLRSLKYVAAVAACALLMSTLIPVVQYVAGNLNSFLPSGWFETTEEDDPPYWEYTPELEPLSKELVEEIEDAYLLYKLKMPVDEYLAQIPDDRKEAAQTMIDHIRLIEKSPYYCIYYGTFRDSVVVASMGNFAEDVNITIGGYSLLYPNNVKVYVYNNGAFYDIEKAYEIGLLTDKDIKIIAERHNINRNKIINGEY